MNLKEHLLDRQAVRLQVQVEDWKEAVKIGTDVLVEKGTVTPRYYDAILRSVEAYGPYFLLGPGMAMPHARPEGGVLENSFALVTLRNPVPFGDPANDPVDLLLILAAKDAATQNKSAIVQVVSLLDCEPAVACLRRATALADVEEAFALAEQQEAQS